MVAQELPVLPHQRVALRAAGQGVEAARPGFTRDLAEALRGWRGIGPEAAQPSGQRQRAKLIGAAERVQEERLELEHRARAAVRGWDRLERAHDAAACAYDRDAARAATGKLEAYARKLKRDAGLEGMLRTRGQEFGVAEGSRLEQVVQAPEVTARLVQQLGLEQAPSQRPSRGMSMVR